MNHLFFSGGPLNGKNFETCAPAGDWFISNGARYERERKFTWAAGRVIHCYVYDGKA